MTGIKNMKIYRIAGKISEDQLYKWISDLVKRKYGGSEESTEGWCGEVAGDIYKYLKSLGENAEIWSLVDWNDEDNYPKISVIDNPTQKEKQNVLDEVTGAFTHSFVKWNNKYWDGKGNRSLEEIMQQHGFGIEALGKGQSIMREF